MCLTPYPRELVRRWNLMIAVSIRYFQFECFELIFHLLICVPFAENNLLTFWLRTTHFISNVCQFANVTISAFLRCRFLQSCCRFLWRLSLNVANLLCGIKYRFKIPFDLCLLLVIRLAIIRMIEHFSTLLHVVKQTLVLLSLNFTLLFFNR